MAQVTTEFVVPCSRDRAVLAIQDTLDQFKWPILELSSSLVVARAREGMVADWMCPKVILVLKDGTTGTETVMSISVSYPGMLLGNKGAFTGLLGKLTNSLSLRVQTESLTINPTVALGQGQGTAYTPNLGTSSQTRAQQLKDLKELLDAGVLSAEEFAVEKARVLSSD
jgi:hypothetical protein